MKKTSEGRTRVSPGGRGWRASILWPGQSERLARVCLWVLSPSRQERRRRMAGGDVRLRTRSMYMGATYSTIPFMSIANSILHGRIYANKHNTPSHKPRHVRDLPQRGA